MLLYNVHVLALAFYVLVTVESTGALTTQPPRSRQN